MCIRLINSKNIKYEYKNARIINLLVRGVNVSLEYLDNSISKLSIEGVLTIEIDTEIGHDLSSIPTNFKVKKIVRNYELDKMGFEGYTLEMSVLNKSYYYLLPVLNINDKFNIDTLMCETYLMNTFVDRDNNLLILCYRYSKSDLYTELENTITSHPYFKKLYQANGFDYYCFSISGELVGLFLEGKYSKLPDWLKTKIKSFHNLRSRDFIMQVLNRDRELKKKLEMYFNVDIGDDIDLDDKPNDSELLVSGDYVY